MAAVNKMAMEADSRAEAAAAGGGRVGWAKAWAGRVGGGGVGGVSPIASTEHAFNVRVCPSATLRGADDGSDSDDEMGEGEGAGGGTANPASGGSARRRRGKATEGFKEQVMEVLQSNGFSERRSAKMSQDDFLQLLAVFNQAGIHFS